MCNRSSGPPLNTSRTAPTRPSRPATRSAARDEVRRRIDCLPAAERRRDHVRPEISKDWAVPRPCLLPARSTRAAVSRSSHGGRSSSVAPPPALAAERRPSPPHADASQSSADATRVTGPPSSSGREVKSVLAQPRFSTSCSALTPNGRCAASNNVACHITHLHPERTTTSAGPPPRFASYLGGPVG